LKTQKIFHFKKPSCPLKCCRCSCKFISCRIRLQVQKHYFRRVLVKVKHVSSTLTNRLGKFG
jgi:hypothetical protein